MRKSTTQGLRKVGRPRLRPEVPRLTREEHSALACIIREFGDPSDWAIAIGKLKGKHAVGARNLHDWVNNKIRTQPAMRFDVAARFYMAGFEMRFEDGGTAWRSAVLAEVPNVLSYHGGYGIKYDPPKRSIEGVFSGPFSPLMMSRAQIPALAKELALSVSVRDRQGSREKSAAAIEAYLTEQHAGWSSSSAFFFQQAIFSLLSESLQDGRLGHPEQTMAEIFAVSEQVYRLVRDIQESDNPDVFSAVLADEQRRVDDARQGHPPRARYPAKGVELRFRGR